MGAENSHPRTGGREECILCLRKETVHWGHLLDTTKGSGFSPQHLHKKKKYLVERVISINTGKAGVSALAVLPERGISTIYNSNTLSGQCRQNILTHKNNKM